MIHKIGRYIWRVIANWYFAVFLALDLILVGIRVFTPYNDIQTWVYLAVAFIGFIIANFLLYLKLEGYEATEANINIMISQSHATIQGNNDTSLTENGIPLQSVISIMVEAVNIGYESGELWIEIDAEKSTISYPFSWTPNDRPRPYTVHERVRKNLPYSISLDTLTDDRAMFDQSIDTIEPYKLTCSYWTKRLDGQSKRRQFIVEGDFAAYKQVLENVREAEAKRRLNEEIRRKADKERNKYAEIIKKSLHQSGEEET